MANPPPSDPFLEVQADVLREISTTRTLFSSYLRIRTLASSRPSADKSEELSSARADLEGTLSTLAADLADLLESVAAVEKDPYRFGLDVAEVQRRRGFVREVGEEVEGMRSELVQGGGSNNVAATTGGAGGRQQSLPSPGQFEERDEGEREGDEDNYAEFEAQQQVQMMREQEQDLDGVFRSVGVLRNQAEDMGRELEEQGAMLDDVDTLADRVGGKLQNGVKRVGEVIRKNEDGLSSCGIAVLILALIVMLILVIVI